MIERNGKLNAQKVDDVKKKTLTHKIIEFVKETANLFTDEWVGYDDITKMYEHSIVKHGQSEYVNVKAHTNIANVFQIIFPHFTEKPPNMPSISFHIHGF